jgi:hypothetical protein
MPGNVSSAKEDGQLRVLSRLRRRIPSGAGGAFAPLSVQPPFRHEPCDVGGERSLPPRCRVRAGDGVLLLVGVMMAGDRWS